MLTKVTENSKVKCYKYWPGKLKTRVFGKFSVCLTGKEKEHGLITRFISLKRVNNDGVDEEKEIYHFQYKEWPDHGKLFFVFFFASF